MFRVLPNTQTFIQSICEIGQKLCDSWKKNTYWASVVRGIRAAQEESFLVKVDVISTRGKWDVVNGVSQDIIRKGVVFNYINFTNTGF